MDIKERLQQFAHVAEIVAAARVVISLQFVGIQLRQSNSIKSTHAIRDSVPGWNQPYRQAFGIEESTAFFRKAMNHCEQLSADERGRFFVLLGNFVGAYDNVYNQYESGQLRKQIFLGMALNYYALVGTTCAKKGWPRITRSCRRGSRARPAWMSWRIIARR